MKGLGNGKLLTNTEKKIISTNLLAHAHQPPEFVPSTRKLLVITNNNMGMLLSSYKSFLHTIGGFICKRESNGDGSLPSQ